MKRVCLLMVLVLAAPSVGWSAEPALLSAIRSDRMSDVGGLLSGDNVNSRDATGATALMYAVLYSSPEMMRLLVTRGADVNAASASGSTALMWAADHPAKITLLVDAGAAVNAKSADGTTALLVAVRHGNAASVRQLLASGADVKAATPDSLLRAVYVRDGSEEVGRLLAAAGLELRNPAALTALLGLGLPMTSFEAAKRILAAGGELGPELQIAALTLPPLHLAAYHGDAVMMRRLIDRGASVNARTSQGATPLMFAAGSPRPSADGIRLLMTSGAELDLRDAAGRTALDWALTQGDTPVVTMLRAQGAPASPAPAVPSPVATPRPVREAVERAVARLQPAGPTFNSRTKCISCHNQSLPSIAVTRASARGVPVDRTLAAHPSQATLASWTPSRDSLLLGRQTIGGFVANVTYGLAGLAEDHVEPNLTTDAVAVALAALQLPDGSWNIDDLRPPIIDQSAIHFTALSIFGLNTYAPPGRRDEIAARVARATTYLRDTAAASTQDEAFKLLGFLWAKTPREEIARQAERVLALQRPDGGWAQVPTMTSDAYATGQALFALRSADVTADAAALQRAAAFLLRTQLDDGSWFVRSRAFGFQAYFDTGFPHGRDQFISSAATAWAAMGLAETLPAQPR